MQVGDTVFHVIGTSPTVRKVRLDTLRKDWFSVFEQRYGLAIWYQGFGEIFDNPIAADQAIVRNIDRAIANHQRQIADLLRDRAIVMARLL